MPSSILRLLGAPEATIDGTWVPLPTKHFATLILLAERHPSEASRAWLARLLWPESDSQSARHSLSQAIYDLKRRLNASIVVAKDEAIRYGDLECDLHNYRDCLATGAFEQATEFINGEFCAGFFVPTCVEFDQWLENARRRFRQSLTALLDEPFDPGLRRRVLTILEGSQDPEAPSRSDGEDSTTTAFVGRITERKILHEAWRESTEENLVTALVFGEPGIGKTSLCLRVAKKTVLHGSRCLMATGYEVQRNLPFGILGQLLNDAHSSGLLGEADRAWLGVLKEICPAIKPETDMAQDSLKVDAHRITAAVQSFLTSLATDRPLTILIDDIQWADAASLGVLHYIAHCTTKIGIFFLLAARPFDRKSELAEQWTPEVTFELKGLEKDEVKQLLKTKALSGKVDTYFGLTGGNPLLLDAIARRPPKEDKTLPQGVRQYFKGELALLSPTARFVGATIAAAGEPFPSDYLPWLTEFSNDVLNNALSELFNSSYLISAEDGAGFTFKHDIVAEAFLDQLGPLDSAKIHGRIANLLRDRGRPPAVIATRLKVSDNANDTRNYALLAAQASERLFAHREAEYFYRLAISNTVDPASEVLSRIALSKTLLRQSKSEEAIAVLTSAPNSSELTLRQRALHEAYLLFARLSKAGPVAVPKQAFHKAKRLEPLLPNSVAAGLYAKVATNAQQGLQDLATTAAHYSNRIIQQLEPGPERLTQAALITPILVMNSTSQADLEELDRLTTESVPWPEAHSACLLSSGVVRYCLGRVLEAQNIFLTALDISERYGMLDSRIRVLNNLGVCSMELAEWSRAEDRFQAILQDGLPIAPKELVSAMYNLLILLYEQEQFGEVIERGNGYLRESPLKTRMQKGALGLMGLAQLELGNIDEARRLNSRISEVESQDAGWTNDISYIEIFRARMMITSGDVQAAEDRLTKKEQAFRQIDYYCSARMRVERIRVSASHHPREAREEANGIRRQLITANAVRSRQRLDRVIARCNHRLN